MSEITLEQLRELMNMYDDASNADARIASTFTQIKLRKRRDEYELACAKYVRQLLASPQQKAACSRCGANSGHLWNCPATPVPGHSVRVPVGFELPTPLPLPEDQNADPMGHEFACGYNQCLEEIENMLSTAPQQAEAVAGWLPESQVEHGVDVLACTARGGRFLGYKIGPNWWREGVGSVDGVTHYMPLPAPPSSGDGRGVGK